MNPEQKRLDEDRAEIKNWRRWGPYLSERQWGTIREDYSPDGDAWGYFTQDQARSRVYRWGEDGLAGLSDDQCRLCFSVVLWNGEDPFLKERLFGLTNAQGNHGEDVKELYYYLDATPTHSYLKYLYKYPQSEFPYDLLLKENARRDRLAPEFELMDTGIFNDNRYFDVFVEYAKVTPNDVLIKISAHNRGPRSSVLHVLPQLWFRNTWSWKSGAARPKIELRDDGVIVAEHEALRAFHFASSLGGEPLFCENETNAHKVFGSPKTPGYFKDGFHDKIVANNPDAVNPRRSGTKSAVHYRLEIPSGGSSTIQARLSRLDHDHPLLDVETILDRRRNEADAFYAEHQAGMTDPDAKLVQRQALAGLIWSKQFYHLDIPKWLHGDPAQPAPPDSRLHARNSDWPHLNNSDILSMPDKWEYPWFAAWDLGFHCVQFAMIDPEFAKAQLVLLTREWYMHPNGELPAYEWKFDDANPPVHAWAAYRVFEIERRARGGPGDLDFLKRVFHKLLLNFTWWVNRKDAQGRNVFQGGFLGLDNIGVFNRSEPLPTGGVINQADGTAWMAMYSLNMLRIAIELGQTDHVYEDLATKFFEHFLYIAKAMTNMADTGIGLWDERDAFYYDVLNMPDGRTNVLRVRSMVCLIPLFAVEILDSEVLERVPGFASRLDWFLNYRPDLAALVSRWQEGGKKERHLLSLLRGSRMKKLLKRMLDETEFLSNYGIRSLSQVHRDRPYVFDECGHEIAVAYLPGESDSGVFGGNSNWRGPIWMPVNFLIVEALRRFHLYYGDDFKVECPTGSGKFLTLAEIADEISKRLARLFLRGVDGRRPVFGDNSRLQNDPQFKDYVLFHEHFHGETGRGLGASHQTGWTALIAYLLQPRPGHHVVEADANPPGE